MQRAQQVQLWKAKEGPDACAVWKEQQCERQDSQALGSIQGHDMDFCPHPKSSSKWGRWEQGATPSMIPKDGSAPCGGSGGAQGCSCCSEEAVLVCQGSGNKRENLAMDYKVGSGCHHLSQAFMLGIRTENTQPSKETVG